MSKLINSVPLRNNQKLKIQIHIGIEDIEKLDEYINIQNITTRKKFIEFLVTKFINNIK
jgi:hypothetical protein